jgi:hypothetical protein
MGKRRRTHSDGGAEACPHHGIVRNLGRPPRSGSSPWSNGLPALAEQLTAEEWTQAGTILMIQPLTASTLDLSLVRVETEVFIGHVRALGKHKGWTSCRNPAEDAGRVHWIGGFDRHA